MCETEAKKCAQRMYKDYINQTHTKCNTDKKKRHKTKIKWKIKLRSEMKEWVDRLRNLEHIWNYIEIHRKKSNIKTI